MKRFIKDPRRVVPAVIALALVVYIFAPFSPYNKQGPLYPAEAQLDYRKLYNDAIKAQQNLQKIAIAKPKYRDTQKLLNEVVAANLYGKLQEALSRNQIPAAQDYLDLLKKIDPDYKDTEDIDKDLKDGSYDDDPGKDGDGNGSAPGVNPPDSNEPTLTPIYVLPDNIPGFELLQRRWIKEPNEANAAYRYKESNKDYFPMIDMVLITAVKTENADQARFRLISEQEDFGQDPEIIDINNHEAYFGLYEEKIFVYPGALLWTQGSWFFSITVLPKPPPHDHRGGSCPDDPNGDKGYVTRGICRKDVERGTILKVAKDIATKFGY